MESIIECFAQETEKTFKKKKMNKALIKMSNSILNFFLCKFYPFFYTILAILLLMFTMNCFQFFYYLKTVDKIKKLDTLSRDMM